MQPVTISLLTGERFTGLAQLQTIFHEQALQIQIPIFDAAGEMTSSKTTLVLIRALATVTIVDELTVRMANLPKQQAQPVYADGYSAGPQPAPPQPQKARVPQPLPNLHGVQQQGPAVPQGFEQVWPAPGGDAPRPAVTGNMSFDAMGVPIYTNENLQPPEAGL